MRVSAVLSIVTCTAHLTLAATLLRPYPLPDANLSTTSILNHAGYLTSFDDAQWYLDNIPFVDFPDKAVQDVYYYRTSVVKRHLKYAHSGHGWVFTEFIQPVGWASKFQTIPDSAGHQILEARWLRDPRYAKDTISLYTRGGAEALGGITYTQFVNQAILEHAQVTGDVEFLTSQLDGMIAMFYLWNSTRDNTTGLYHRTPLSDAQEFSLPGYLVGGPNGGPVQQWNSMDNDETLIWLGPETYRISFNSYMVAAARSIATVASLAGEASLAALWNQTSRDLDAKMQAMLYDNDINFWIDVIQHTNEPVVGRQSIGFYPYRFNVATSNSQVRGLEASLDTTHFLTQYGPTTLEQINPYYTPFKNITYCCLWQGQSWPFTTAIYLDTLAKLAQTGRSTLVTPAFYQAAFETYTMTNYKDGVPYTAEAHYPTINAWSGDTTNHSENYFHSTYIDNLFTGLLGIVPTLDSRLELRPLVPSGWSYFAVENIPYHGSLISILWDKDGTQYKNFPHYAGLSVYSDGTLLHNQPTLAFVNVSLTYNVPTAVAALADAPRYANILCNPNSPWGLPLVTSDYQFTSNGDQLPYPPWKLNDGLTWYDTTPDNFWTNNQSYSVYSTLSITLPRPRTFSSLSLAILNDAARGGNLDCPAAIKITDATTNTTLAYLDPWTDCTPNALNTIALLASTTASLTLTLLNKLNSAVAISELQIWVPTPTGPRYEAEDGLVGTFIGAFEGAKSGLNATVKPPSAGSSINGGVVLYANGWVEIADVVAPAGAGRRSVVVIGSGPGVLSLQMNFLGGGSVASVAFSGLTSLGTLVQNRTVEVDFLEGGNVVTLFQVSGAPFVDAIVVL